MAEKIVEVENLEEAYGIFGELDSNVRIIESEYNVTVNLRDGVIKAVGEETNASMAAKTVEGLLALLRKGERIGEQNVRYVMGLVGEGTVEQIDELGNDCITITLKGKPIKAKTIGQKAYTDAIKNNTVVFGEGPAGTGKTYLAVAVAVNSFRNHEVSRIVLTRPAVEAGESLGFLPGDLQMKIDPYLRPLYDALSDMFGAENYQKYLENGSIEIAPLAYMRGRTLDDSFIILDEAQNTTPEQMKMFLTRLGYRSKAVVTGDVTQIDLPMSKKSGMKEAMRILRNIDGIETVHFTERDVVRNPLVQKIIRAYEKDTKEQK